MNIYFRGEELFQRIPSAIKVIPIGSRPYQSYSGSVGIESRPSRLLYYLTSERSRLPYYLTCGQSMAWKMPMPSDAL